MVLPDIHLIKDRLEYDETSPSGLRWKVSMKNGKGVNSDFAGYKRPNGYWFTGVDKRQYQNGLLVLLLNNHYPTDGDVVDHLDGNPSNNSIENLRFVNRAVNSRNRKLPSSNYTGVHGVYTQNDMVCASWHDLSGALRRKYFSINKHGYEVALRLAIEFRQTQICALNESGAGYTSRHIIGGTD